MNNELNINEPYYVKYYYDNATNKTLMKQLTNPILLVLVDIMTSAKNGQLVLINAYTKKMISRKLSMSDLTIQKELDKFLQDKIMFTISKGVYRINPMYYGKGEWHDICTLRKTCGF